MQLKQSLTTLATSLLGWNFPASQGEHADLGKRTYKPAAQNLHAELLGTSAYIPTTQSLHCDSDNLSWYVPNGHA